MLQARPLSFVWLETSPASWKVTFLRPILFLCNHGISAGQGLYSVRMIETFLGVISESLPGACGQAINNQRTSTRGNTQSPTVWLALPKPSNDGTFGVCTLDDPVQLFGACPIGALSNLFQLCFNVWGVVWGNVRPIELPIANRFSGNKKHGEAMSSDSFPLKPTREHYTVTYGL